MTDTLTSNKKKKFYQVGLNVQRRLFETYAKNDSKHSICEIYNIPGARVVVVVEVVVMLDGTINKNVNYTHGYIISVCFIFELRKRSYVYQFDVYFAI